MAAYRCGTCQLNWPSASTFNPCPVCLGKTKRFITAEAMDLYEARTLMTTARFERYYTRREGEREAKGLPTPEDVGKREAHELLALEKALEDAES